MANYDEINDLFRSIWTDALLAEGNNRLLWNMLTGEPGLVVEWNLDPDMEMDIGL